MFKGRRFPANDITWDNFHWAFGKGARWTLIWWWTEKFFQACHDLRLNVPMEEEVV